MLLCEGSCTGCCEEGQNDWFRQTALEVEKGKFVEKKVWDDIQAMQVCHKGLVASPPVCCYQEMAFCVFLLILKKAQLCEHFNQMLNIPSTFSVNGISHLLQRAQSCRQAEPWSTHLAFYLNFSRPAPSPFWATYLSHSHQQDRCMVPVACAVFERWAACIRSCSYAGVTLHYAPGIYYYSATNSLDLCMARVFPHCISSMCSSSHSFLSQVRAIKLLVTTSVTREKKTFTCSTCTCKFCTVPIDFVR